MAGERGGDKGAEMTATNGWPGKPGVPPQDGVYWLKHKAVGDKQPCLYDEGKWYCCGSDIGLSPMQAAAGYSYLGPVLTPDEAAALQARIAELEATLAALQRDASQEIATDELVRRLQHLGDWQAADRIEALQKRIAELEAENAALVANQTPFDELAAAIMEIGSIVNKARAALAGGKDE